MLLLADMNISLPLHFIRMVGPALAHRARQRTPSSHWGREDE